MRRHRIDLDPLEKKDTSFASPRSNPEQGIVIVLVAVVMLFVIGAMAALSIDVVTLYTARSEAQLAADAAALAGARALANSGSTSDSALVTGAQNFAKTVATQVAQSSMVGGRYLNAAAGEVAIAFGGTTTSPCPVNDPCVTVKVQRTDLPTFFARIWGSTQVTVGASATAEAYNPTPATGTVVGANTVPVAPICVKPWLLPNMDPTNAGATIFDPIAGTVNAKSTLLGWSSFTLVTGTQMILVCPGGCSSTPMPTPQTWQYYPGDDDPTSFPHPIQALPTCNPALITGYQKSIAGCVQTPLACNSSLVNIDTNAYATRNADTADAVNCLTHATATGGGDTAAVTYPPSAAFQFYAGADNPIPGLSGSEVVVSDSLVTVPVFNIPITGAAPTNPVQIVGFVQLFLNPDGNATTPSGINTTVINLVGCGTGASGNPVVGNGASPVAVRLISGP